MKLFLETAPAFFIEENEILAALFEEGLDFLLLNKPSQAPVYYERLLSLIPSQYYKRIITCDHFYLQTEYRIQGIHLLNNGAEIPANYKGTKGMSCDSLQQIQENRKKFDYLLFGPLPNDVEKSNAPIADAFRSAKVKGLIDKRIVACGEIDEKNILYLKKCDVGAIALSSSFWKRFDSRCDTAYNNLIDYFKTLKKSTE